MQPWTSDHHHHPPQHPHQQVSSLMTTTSSFHPSPTSFTSSTNSNSSSFRTRRNQTHFVNGCTQSISSNNNNNYSGHSLPHAQSFIMSTTSTNSSSIIPRNVFQELDPVVSKVSTNQSTQCQSINHVHQSLPMADHGFPEKFYLALREIFDVLDDSKVGLLQVAEIESRWDIDNESSMFTPKGLMDCLRKVSPSDGYIDFDHFCAAIKICLLQNQNVSNVSKMSNGTSMARDSQRSGKSGTSIMKTRSASVPVAEDREPESEEQFKRGLKTTGFINPVPMTNGYPMTNPQQLVNNGVPNGTIGMKRVSTEIPIKPERLSIINSGSSTVPRTSKAKGINGIKKTLNKWKDNVFETRVISGLINNGIKDSVRKKTPPPSSQELDTAIGTTTSATSSSSDMELPPGFRSMNRSTTNGTNQSINRGNKNQNRGRERRSTVGVTSIDYNQLKRMTLLQHEKDLLLRGLQAVDRSRDWYMRQMNLIQEKIRICGRGTFSPSSESFEVLQERLQFKANRIISANQHLVALMDEANFPIHMNLAFKPLLAPHLVLPQFNDTLDTVEAQRLQEQNSILSAEVSNKNQVIQKLTKERQSLLELLQRTSNGSVNGTSINHGMSMANGHGSMNGNSNNVSNFV